eukprot:scaffold68728_cov51-Phaeocystis_antarctica.AAC.1
MQVPVRTHAARRVPIERRVGCVVGVQVCSRCNWRRPTRGDVVTGEAATDIGAELVVPPAPDV